MSSFSQNSTDKNGTSASASSRSASPAPSLQPNAPKKHPFETPAEQLEQDDSSMSGDGLSRPITPIQVQDQDELEVDAQLNEITPSVLLKCNVCGSKFGRMQERNRHIESYLPHSIYCTFQGCPWTGRRQWDFKEHWKRKHPEAGKAPGEDANEIYDPKDFVKSIVDGTPVAEVARSAFTKVQECLGRLGKPDVGTNVLGRNRDLRMWIRSIPSSQLN